MVRNELRFDEQVAVVTGAGGGLGREYALLLASRGARVVVNDIGGSVMGDGSDRGASETVADEIRERGGEAVADSHSVTDPEGARAIIDAALSSWGRVDIVINNAGIVRDMPFDDMTIDQFDKLLDVHLRGAFNVTKPAWTVMKRQGYGRIVNTTSAAGILGTERMSNYGSAKTGLIGLTRVLSIEGAEHGIAVNAVAPIAYTRMLEHSIATALPPDDAASQTVLEELKSQYLQKLDPALVASVVCFLAHRDCPVSGEIYTVGAGHFSRFFVGRTKGVYRPDLSLEDVRDHLDEARDETGYTVPTSPADEMAQLFMTLTASQPD
jgi:NAD(P)-dependent dehydrogenase (short-subunit alcohol dehydrogenase family)